MQSPDLTLSEKLIIVYRILHQSIHSTSNPGNCQTLFFKPGFVKGKCDPGPALWSSESRRNFQQVLSANFVRPCKSALW